MQQEGVAIASSPMSELERILLCQDVGLSVLSHLPITDVASLSCTCSRLRVRSVPAVVCLVACLVGLGVSMDCMQGFLRTTEAVYEPYCSAFGVSSLEGWQVASYYELYKGLLHKYGSLAGMPSLNRWHAIAISAFRSHMARWDSSNDAVSRPVVRECALSWLLSPGGDLPTWHIWQCHHPTATERQRSEGRHLRDRARGVDASFCQVCAQMTFGKSQATGS